MKEGPSVEIPRAWAEVSRGCFGCGSDNPIGLHLNFERGDGWAEVRTTLSLDRQGWPGVAHGGIVSALLDEAMSYSIGATERPAYTAELAVRFIRPVPVDAPIIIRAKRSSQKGRLCTAHATVEDATGTTLARGEAKFLLVPNSAAPKGLLAR